MIHPVRDLVYIRPIFDSSKSASGLLLIPEEAKSRCDQGIVVYVGPKVKDIVPGDYVLFPNYNGSLMLIDDRKFIIMEENAVTAILDLLHENMVIPGLYIKLDAPIGDLPCQYEPEYEEVTYETAWTIMGDALSENPYFKEMREKKKKRQIDK